MAPEGVSFYPASVPQTLGQEPAPDRVYTRKEYVENLLDVRTRYKQAALASINDPGMVVEAGKYQRAFTMLWAKAPQLEAETRRSIAYMRAAGFGSQAAEYEALLPENTRGELVAQGFNPSLMENRAHPFHYLNMGFDQVSAERAARANTPEASPDDQAWASLVSINGGFTSGAPADAIEKANRFDSLRDTLKSAAAGIPEETLKKSDVEFRTMAQLAAEAGITTGAADIVTRKAIAQRNPKAIDAGFDALQQVRTSLGVLAGYEKKSPGFSSTAVTYLSDPKLAEGATTEQISKAFQLNEEMRKFRDTTQARLVSSGGDVADVAKYTDAKERIRGTALGLFSYSAEELAADKNTISLQEEKAMATSALSMLRPTTEMADAVEILGTVGNDAIPESVLPKDSPARQVLSTVGSLVQARGAELDDNERNLATAIDKRNTPAQILESINGILQSGIEAARASGQEPTAEIVNVATQVAKRVKDGAAPAGVAERMAWEAGKTDAPEGAKSTNIGGMVSEVERDRAELQSDAYDKLKNALEQSKLAGENFSQFQNRLKGVKAGRLKIDVADYLGADALADAAAQYGLKTGAGATALSRNLAGNAVMNAVASSDALAALGPVLGPTAFAMGYANTGRGRRAIRRIVTGKEQEPAAFASDPVMQIVQAADAQAWASQRLTAKATGLTFEGSVSTAKGRTGGIKYNGVEYNDLDSASLGSMITAVLKDTNPKIKLDGEFKSRYEAQKALDELIASDRMDVFTPDVMAKIRNSISVPKAVDPVAQLNAYKDQAMQEGRIEDAKNIDEMLYRRQSLASTERMKGAELLYGLKKQEGINATAIERARIMSEGDIREKEITAAD